MDTSETYIKMCDCPEIQGLEFNHRPNFYFAYYLHERWQIEHEFLGGEKSPIWFPRQDQIQEMFFSKSGLVIHLLNRFYDYYTQQVKNNHAWMLTFDSPEKIWLSFYMHNKHSKIWDGDKWMKRK